MTRLAFLVLALALPLAACDAGSVTETGRAAAAQPVAGEAAEPAPTAAETPVAASTTPAAIPAPAADTQQIAQAAPSAERFQEGRNYVRLPAAQPTDSSPGQVEVVETFMYSCPHCNALEPFMARWLSTKPANVDFVRIPVNFNPVAALHMRAFYAAQALGKLDSMHQAFLDEIHVKKNPMQDVAALTKFFAAHGVDEKTFAETMSSFDIDTQMRRAETLARRYQISSVPAIIINGKYKTDTTMAGSHEALFDLIDFLIARESAAGASAAADPEPPQG